MCVHGPLFFFLNSHDPINHATGWLIILAPIPAVIEGFIGLLAGSVIVVNKSTEDRNDKNP